MDRIENYYKNEETLGDLLPNEFHKEYIDTRAYKYKDVKVLKQFDARYFPWPSTSLNGPKNITFWYYLENGFAVGFNENPSRGWSFPVTNAREWIIHITHCCSEHGCKYGDNNCPVVNGWTPQMFPCIDCNESIEKFVQGNAEEFKRLVTIQDFEAHGGVIEEDRELYDKEGKCIGYYLEFDDNQKTHLMWNTTYNSCPIASTMTYVKINVIPLWK